MSFLSIALDQTPVCRLNLMRCHHRHHGWIYRLSFDVATNHRRVFNDFEMFDAKVASALRKIISSTSFRRRVSAEEQRAQKYNRFLRGIQIACKIFLDTELHGSEQIQTVSAFYNQELKSRSGDAELSKNTKWYGAQVVQFFLSPK